MKSEFVQRVLVRPRLAEDGSRYPAEESYHLGERRCPWICGSNGRTQLMGLLYSWCGVRVHRDGEGELFCILLQSTYICLALHAKLALANLPLFMLQLSELNLQSFILSLEWHRSTLAQDLDPNGPSI